MDTTFPGGLSELEFVEAYWFSALRKPQMAADAALRALVFSDTGDRAVLTGLIGQELAEACRRLTSIYGALSDRRYSIARSLLKPLPGLDGWKVFIHHAATFTPEQMLRELSLDSTALRWAIELRGQSDMSGLNDLVEAAASGSSMLLVPGMMQKHIATECWFAGVRPNGEPIAASFGFEEQDAANLADLAADFCAIARGFLGTYLETRRTAGWRGEP